MFNLNTRNHENISLAESAEFAETNLKVDPTLPPYVKVVVASINGG